MQLAALALAAGVVLAGAGTAAASGWLETETTQAEPLVFDPSALVGLPDLSAYGELTVLREPQPRRVADRVAASAVTGLELPVVAARSHGIRSDPVYVVTDEARAVFTLSTGRDGWATAQLDGTRIQLAAGPAAAALWPGVTGMPALIVARAVAPTATSSGVPLETVCEYLIERSGLPDDLAQRLRSFAADGSALPLPVPGSHVDTSLTEVGGVAATVLSTADGTLAAVVWLDDGVITIVAGSLGEDELLTIARGLR
jgi:hypothetical protein